MKKATRLIALTMALLLAVGAGLTGCKKEETNSNSSSADSGNSSGDGQSTSTPETWEEITLNYWNLGNGEQKDSKKVWAEVDRLVQEHLPNTSINWTLIPGSEYKEKWARAMAAQEAIDLAWTGYAINLQDEVNKGALMELDDLIAEYGQDIVATLGETVMDIHRFVDGKTYQVIAWQGLVGSRSAFRLPAEIAELAGGEQYAKELQEICYENYNIPTAEAKKKVYDKVEEYLKAAKDGGKLGQGYPPERLEGWYTAKGTVGFSQGGGSNDSTFYIEKFDDTFTVKNWFESEQMKMNYEYMAKWFTEGYIRKDAGSLEKIEVSFAKDGLDGYILEMHNGFTDTIAEEETVKAGFDVLAAYTQPECEYVLGTATGTSIPKTSKHPERAMQLINLFYSEDGKEAYQTYVYGIKDEHWVDNGDGTVKWLCGDGSQGTTDWDYGNMKWTQGTCMFSLVTQADVKGYYDVLKEKEDSAWVNPLLSFKFDNTNVQTAAAQVNAVIEEYKKTLQRGTKGVDGWEAYYNEFIDKLKAAGIDDLKAEAQKQVDEYVKANNSKWTPQD